MTTTADHPEEAFALTTSRGFVVWLASSGSIAYTTYQGGKLFLLGIRPDGTLAVHERSISRCMGVAVTPDLVP